MEGNPYSKLANMFGGEKVGALILRRGSVRTVQPLSIDVGGITANSNELMINSAMLTHEEQVVPIGAEPPSFTAKVTPKLSAGDSVILLTEDDQTFYVVCKVVKST